MPNRRNISLLCALCAIFMILGLKNLFGWEPVGDRVVAQLAAERLPSAWRDKMRDSKELSTAFFDGVRCAAEGKPLDKLRETLDSIYGEPLDAGAIRSAGEFGSGSGRAIAFSILVTALRRGDDQTALFFFGVLTRSLIAETACDNDPVVRFAKEHSPLAPLLDPTWLTANPEALSIVRRRCDSLDLSEKEFVNANAMIVRLFLLQWTGRDATPFGRELLEAASEVEKNISGANERFTEVWADIVSFPVAETLKAFNAAEKIAATDEECRWYYLHGLYELEVNLRNERPLENDVFARPFVQRSGTPLAEYRVVYDGICRKTVGLFDADSRLRAVALAECLRVNHLSAALFDAREIFHDAPDPTTMKLLIVPAETVRDYYWFSGKNFVERLCDYAESGGKILWFGVVPEELASNANVLRIPTAEINLTWNGAAVTLDEKSATKFLAALEEMGANSAFVPRQIAPRPPERNGWNGQSELDFGF